MATSSTRALWKGAISFGLVHIPVALHSAIEESRPKMRLIDTETNAPVGHKNISKATGEAVDQADIVKGIETGPSTGQFVTLTKDEIREALPRTTQTIGIEAFVKDTAIQSVYFNKPYYVSPVAKGAKPFALLREVLRRTGYVGLGLVVISTRQHLAVVSAHENGLVLNLLRWAEEIRDMRGLALPGDPDEVGITARELKMGEQLVMDLAEDEFRPERFHDEYREKIEKLVEQKKRVGDITALKGLLADEILPETAEVVDLTELLRRSLRSKLPPEEKAATPARVSRARTVAANDEVPARAVAASKTSAKARTTVKPARSKKKP